MSQRLRELFKDNALVEKIKIRLPILFQLAELESSRAGKIGMEVGSIREQIIVSLFMYKFGEENVNTNIPITESEVDCKIFNEPVSIKTITGKNLSGVKMIWTVDTEKAVAFKNSYYPSCDMVLAHIIWESKGGLYYIPLEVQKKVFEEIGRENYIKLPKKGTNPRGVEFTKTAIESMLINEKCESIQIEWRRKDMRINPYKRWIEMWEKDTL